MPSTFTSSATSLRCRSALREGFPVVAAQQVNKKNVFPGTAAHGPRLDLAQTDIAQRENAQRLEKGPGIFFTLKASEVLSALSYARTAAFHA
jgi:hypothetical protein